MSVTRKCAYCGTPFTAARKHARFCSARCRVYWNREHPEGVTRDTPPQEPPPVTRNKRPRNWNGKSNDKRQRELKAEKRTANYLDLVNFQLQIARMCVVLESYDMIRDFPAETVNMWSMEAIEDDLVTLGDWWDRTLSAVQGWLADNTMREKIAKLRNVDGRPPEEAAAFLRMADRLERKLEVRLESAPRPVTRNNERTEEI